LQIALRSAACSELGRAVVQSDAKRIDAAQRRSFQSSKKFQILHPKTEQTSHAMNAFTYESIFIAGASSRFES